MESPPPFFSGLPRLQGLVPKGEACGAWRNPTSRIAKGRQPPVRQNANGFDTKKLFFKN